MYDMTEIDGFEEGRLRQHHSIRGDMKSCRSPQQGASLFSHNLLVCQLLQDSESSDWHYKSQDQRIYHVM
jgi:hypothetical protein